MSSKMRRISHSVIVLALLLPAVWYLDAHAADAAGTVSYTSQWGDFKADVPDGWKKSFDVEGAVAHFTDTNFKSPDAAYSMAIRWYTRYVTHRLPNGVLEMYGPGPDDYAKQTLGNDIYKNSEIIEPVHDVEVGGAEGQAVYRPFEGIGPGHSDLE